MGRNVKVPATRACDYCRLRKIKCIASEAGKDCQACTLGELDCSYIMPNKRRGPPPKRQEEHSRGSSRSDVDSAINFGDRRQPDRPIFWWQLTLCFSNVLGASARFLPKLRDNYARLSGCPLRTYASPAHSDIRNGKHHHDLTFQMFCLAMCGCVFGILPHKFEQYTEQDASVGFTDRRTAIADIHHAIMVARPPDYQDELSHEKWAIMYLMSVTNAHLGHRNRAKLQFAECNTIVTELGMHRIASYRELDYVESQLRKKAFWLSYIGWSHSRTRDVDFDSIADRFKFETADAEHLMPMEIDDEYITTTEIRAQPIEKVPLVSGLNALIHISECLVPIFKDASSTPLSFHTIDEHCHVDLGSCACGKHIQKAPLQPSIMTRLIKATHALDNIPPQLSCWTASETPSDAQFQIMTANIHVTHVWVQSLLLEHLVVLNNAHEATYQDQAYHRKLIWNLREGICEQLMDVLNNISEANLKPNGYVLIVKARTVAASLLDCALEGEHTTIHRARTYLQSFADILARLDESYRNDDTSRLWKEFHARF
ncbi:hypothetical protein D6C84_07200 [Aureobasidium pullulans]|uniref:Zn(2)-C6 fungal-type domain-containing protein n=1 Tax=Aureobasidium pullulans TaxID=5580 RepID=A0A4S9XNL3_AURPU|nr:hypothetical protein D6C84_07200 [Aureobasidium pullulans]